MEENDQLTHMMADSPTRSILWKLYEKTRLREDMKREREVLGKDRCLLSKDYKMGKLLESDLFVAGERNVANVLMGAGASIVEGVVQKLWVSGKPIYELNNVS